MYYSTISKSIFLIQNYLVIVLLCLLNTFTLSAQKSINTAGGDANNGSNESIAYSVGQVFVEQISNGIIHLSEGVQQPYELNTARVEVNGYELTVIIFPNPTQDEIHIEHAFNTLGHYTLHLIDYAGRIVKNIELVDQSITLSVKELPMASYHLLLYNEKNELLVNEQIVKY